jgi:hypothetical protein
LDFYFYYYYYYYYFFCFFCFYYYFYFFSRAGLGTRCGRSAVVLLTPDPAGSR